MKNWVKEIEKLRQQIRLKPKEKHVLYYTMGDCYQQMNEKEKAFECFLVSATLGMAKAQHNVGNYYFERNDRRAVEYYKMAAYQGLGVAAMNLGNCYLNGLLVEKDVGMARKVFEGVVEKGGMLAKEAASIVNLK